MPTILDSSVVLDLLDDRSPSFGWSLKWFEASARADAVVINTVVFAETSGRFVKVDDALTVFGELGLSYEAIPSEAAHAAGRAYVSYRRNGGLKDRMLADFLIGAHAAVTGYRLVTRDSARYRSYFGGLDVIAPDTHP